jgi:hydroxylaminobenzene mutase
MLVFLGVILGAALSAFTNPRMAVASHQQAIVAGILLMVFAITWLQAGLVGRRARLTERFLIIGAYTIWIGTLLAASFGTSRATPIFGAGFVGARWQELSVALILMLGSVCSIVGVGSVLVGLLRAGEVLPGHSR